MTKAHFSAFILVVFGLMFLPSPSHAADYSPGDPCSAAGAFHQTNDNSGMDFLICDGSNWQSTLYFGSDGGLTINKLSGQPAPQFTGGGGGGSLTPATIVSGKYSTGGVFSCATNPTCSWDYSTGTDASFLYDDVTGTGGVNFSLNICALELSERSLIVNATLHKDGASATAHYVYSDDGLNWTNLGEEASNPAQTVTRVAKYIGVYGNSGGSYSCHEIDVEAYEWPLGGGGAGGSLADGDKGDITVSGSGTAWDIDADSIGSAEIANNAIGSTEIADGSVANDDLAGSIALSKLSITGTPDGSKYLRDDGTWQTVSGGGGTPAGSDTEIQFNNSGAFGSSTNLTWDGATFTASGDIDYTGVITDISDRRFKVNVSPLEDSLEGILTLQGYSFAMKDDPDGEIEYGLMAQDVQPVFPELVKTNSEGRMSLNYTGLIAPMVEAMKAQQATIEAQQQEIDDLNKRLSALERLFATNNTLDNKGEE